MNDMSSLARWGYRLALLGAVIAVLGTLGFRFQVMDFRLALMGLAGGAAVALLAVLLSAAGLLATMTGSKSGTGTAVAGLIVGLIVAVPVFSSAYVGSTVPPIHDISTDLADPPGFVAVLARRGPEANPVDRAKPADLAEQQRLAYPDIQPLAVNLPPAAAFNAARAAAEQMGWEVVAAEKADGRIEATATTTVMGFKDDIVIRVRDAGDGSIVDVRSVSRVGQSDLGANAARIRSYLAALEKRAGAAG